MQQFAGLLQALPRNFAYGLKALLDERGGVPEPAAEEAEAAITTETEPEAPAAEEAAASEPEPAADAAEETPEES
jgi:hypothetical protein